MFDNHPFIKHMKNFFIGFFCSGVLVCIIGIVYWYIDKNYFGEEYITSAQVVSKQSNKNKCDIVMIPVSNGNYSNLVPMTTCDNDEWILKLYINKYNTTTTTKVSKDVYDNVSKGIKVNVTIVKSVVNDAYYIKSIDGFIK